MLDNCRTGRHTFSCMQQHVTRGGVNDSKASHAQRLGLSRFHHRRKASEQVKPFCFEVFMLIRLNNCDVDVLIDDDSYDVVKGYKWMLLGSAPYLYAISYHDNTHTLMHRLIAKANQGEIVDHINHNTLDNRKANIRVCSHCENMANRKMSKSNKTGVRGVYLDTRYKNKDVYRAEVRSNGERHRKTFTSLDDAKHWVMEMSKHLHGNFACLDGLSTPSACPIV